MNLFQGEKKKEKKSAGLCPQPKPQNSARKKTCDTLDNAEDTKLIILLNSTIIQQQEADKC